ncbi:PAS domain S-box protein [Sphingomonas suaedae]|uniref:histidine kinase n=1 Tax=Sphingomonas suaedae TaxID=2599297 RepID=A0A518RB20_9SPHN|nr:PAS domain-containing protein [Sphingomonas suaedae]QDX24656.1 PAS domain S-box protein [Sphingomonas suaedae]
MLLRAQLVLIACAVALTLISLVGWLFDAPYLTGTQFGTPMLPGAIALTLLCSYAIVRTARDRDTGKTGMRRSARIAAWAAVILGLIGLGRHLLGYHDIDGARQLLGAGWIHVSSAAALGNIIIGVALLLPRSVGRGYVYPTLLITPIPALITALLGYAMDAPTLLDAPMFSELSLFATLALALLIPAALLLRPDSGWMAIVTSPSPAGHTARVLLVAAFLLPLGITGLVQVGRLAGVVRYPFGYGAAIVLGVASLAIIAITVASRLDRSDKAARSVQNLVEAIIENTPALIYAKDEAGRFLRVNRRLAESLGLPRDAIVGKTDNDFFPAELAAAYRAADRQVMTSRTALIGEEETRFEGRSQTYLSSKAPLLDEQGESIGIVGISIDITAQKSAEALLALKVQRLKLLDEITRAIARRHDIASIFQAAVVAVEEQFDADLALIGRVAPSGATIEVAQMGPQTHRYRDAFGLSIGREIRATGNPVADCIAQRELIHVDGSAQDVRPGTPAFVTQMGSICITPILVDDEVYGVLIAARRDRDSFDPAECRFLTQLVDHIGLSVQQSIVLETLQRTVEDLRMSQSSALARERLAAIGQMASGIAHDLNNALTPISIRTQSLRENSRDLPPEIQTYLQMVERVFNDMSATIARMRDFYRTDNADLERAPTDLGELIGEVIELTRARWSDMPRQNGVVITVEAELAADLPPALAHTASIRDALTNLILNAVDAMPGGGAIRVRAYPLPSGADERVALEISDTGEGMDAETLAHCIDPFFTTKGDRGTGLGLAMVVAAAQRHGAELEIESSPGVGTTMRMSLPVASAAIIAQPGSVPAARATGQRAETRILIVDDDPAVLESTAGYLSIIGYDVTAAEGGQRGIEELTRAVDAQQPFDILITDLGMPHVDGDRVAAAAKAIAPDTFVIMLTGWGKRLPDGRDNPANVDALLAKPPDLGKLRALLDTVSR